MADARKDLDRRDMVDELIRTNQELVGTVKRLRRFFTVGFVALLLVYVGGGKWLWDTARSAESASSTSTRAITQVENVAGASRQVAVETTTALCTFRGDLRDRREAAKDKLARSRAFLRDHPDGIPGIEVGLLRTTVANDRLAVRNLRRTISALSALDCPKPVPAPRPRGGPRGHD